MGRSRSLCFLPLSPGSFLLPTKSDQLWKKIHLAKQHGRRRGEPRKHIIPLFLWLNVVWVAFGPNRKKPRRYGCPLCVRPSVRSTVFGAWGRMIMVPFLPSSYYGVLWASLSLAYRISFTASQKLLINRASLQRIFITFPGLTRASLEVRSFLRLPR